MLSWEGRPSRKKHRRSMQDSASFEKRGACSCRAIGIGDASPCKRRKGRAFSSRQHQLRVSVNAAAS